MMKKLFIGLFLAITFIFVTETNAQSVSGSIGTVKKGGSAKGTVSLSLPGGLHVNSNSPGSEYAIPTTVSVSGAGVKVTRVTYPRGVSRSYSYSNGSVRVYEGKTNFGFTVTVPAGYKGTTFKIRAVVRYQGCTNDVCYPPTSKEVTLTGKVN